VSAFRKPRLMAMFRREFTALSEELERVGMALVQHPSSTELADRAMRALHTLKGNCYLMGLTAMGDLTHGLESRLIARKAFSADASTSASQAVLWVVDRLRVMVETPEAAIGDALEELEQVLESTGRRRMPTLESAAAVADGEASVRTPIGELVELFELSERTRTDLLRGASRRELESRVSDIGSRLLRLRKARAGDIETRLNRLVLETASQLGRDVEFVILGQRCEIEVPIFEDLRDVLPHMLRNAIDHGIEPPEERIAAGKPLRARLTLEFRDTGRALEVVVGDDGRGIDRELVVAKALERGVVTQREVRAMTHYEELRLVLRPGFSTRDEATAVSGRGVGFDVVAERVARHGGRLEIDTVPSSGTRVELHFPSPYHADDLLLVRLANRVIGVPVRHIAEILPASSAPRSELGLLKWQTALLPVIGLAGLDPRFGADESRPWVLLEVPGQGAGLAFGVDELVGFERVLLQAWPASSSQPHLTGLGRTRAGEVVWGIDAGTLARRWNEYTVPVLDGAMDAGPIAETG